MATFEQLNQFIQAAPRTQHNVETADGIFDPTGASWGHVEGFGVPLMEDYPQADVFPYMHMLSILVFPAMVMYTEGKATKSWMGTGSKYWMDFALLFYCVGMVLDSLVTVNGTYVGHNRGGLEGNANIRQFAEHFERKGWTFAQGFVLHELIILVSFGIVWYYARAQRNMFWAYFTFIIGAARFIGWHSWPKTEGLLDFGLFWRQLTGLARKYQGGGPQKAVVVY